MSVFYYHPHNAVAKKLSEMTNMHGFMYENRGVLEFKLRAQLSDAGYDVWPQFHTVIGSLAGPIDLRLPLNPDNELDRYTLKLCKNSRAPWCYIKVVNGPNMSGVIGYCSTGAQNPFGMGAIEQAQRGLTNATYVPRPV